MINTLQTHKVGDILLGRYCKAQTSFAEVTVAVALHFITGKANKHLNFS